MHRKLAVSALALLLLCFCHPLSARADVTIYPAPPGEKASPDYTVAVNGQPVHVYSVETFVGERASFASFEFSGAVTVTVTPTAKVTTAKVLPASFRIAPKVTGQAVTFRLNRPRNLTLEMNGEYARALHLFANPMETDAPSPDDPDVLYFGPGVHDIGVTRLRSGQTVYLAGGAIVRPHIPAGEKPIVEKNWVGNKVYENLFVAEGADRVTIRGRGILDMSELPWHSRAAFSFTNCTNVRVEGVTILDAPAWVVVLVGTRDATVRNVKEICKRYNSDGIDICNSQDVLVEDCFLRNNDDEVCVKTISPPPALESRRIRVQRCVIWNERARGMGITSETRANIDDVLFRDCDVIHDFSKGGDCASLAVLVSDSGTMTNIRFEEIRVEDVRDTLINGWIGADMWGHDKERGHVNGVVFRNIDAHGPGTPVSRLSGFDATHLFENVTLRSVRINGKRVSSLDDAHMTVNAFVRGVKVLAR